MTVFEEVVEGLRVSLSSRGIPEELGESVSFYRSLGILQQLVEGVCSKLSLVILHMRRQCRRRVVASVAHGTLVRLLRVMSLLVDLEVIAERREKEEER